LVENNFFSAVLEVEDEEILSPDRNIKDLLAGIAGKPNHLSGAGGIAW
jgi:hypothetical protein